MENNTPTFTETFENGNKPKSIEELLIAQRQEWVSSIEEMNEMMKTLQKTDELLNIIYTKRQKAVDYYYGMNNVILKHAKEYKAMYNNMFNNIKVNGYNGIRFSSDSAIQRQIETDLQDKKELIDMLTNQNNYIKETIATIDNIIYGVNQKVKIKEMLNGLKF